MGTDKNIKLHIVTDIKSLDKKMHRLVHRLLHIQRRHHHTEGRPLNIHEVKVMSKRCKVEGLISDKPYEMRFGWIPMTVVLCVFTGVGSYMAWKGARILEDLELFVHDDDDD